MCVAEWGKERDRGKGKTEEKENGLLPNRMREVENREKGRGKGRMAKRRKWKGPIRKRVKREMREWETQPT